ncbi:hypothetical protein ABK040_006301 [Willaertia magna]
MSSTKRKQSPTNNNNEQKKVKQNSFYDDEVTLSQDENFKQVPFGSPTSTFEETTFSQNLDSSVLDDDLNNNNNNHNNNNGSVFGTQDFETPSSPQYNSNNHHNNNNLSPVRTPKTDKSNQNSNSNSTQQKKKISSSEKLKLNEKIEKEKQILLQIQGNVKDNRNLYEAFNNLQTVAHEHNLKFETPELVVVGMQSDGKSSFVEALLGFQFNTVDTQIGTRRPLLLQMINDPSAEKPICYFMKEDKTTELEEESTPVPSLEKEIRRRTEEVCGKTNVSSRPIILRVKYRYCANLTIVDTPGFRKGETDPLSERIYKCVTSYIKKPNTIIVALEQSTVEWCNTQVRPIIKKYDPNFERTVFVITKFNNRLNQFRDEQETNGYLATDNQIKDLSKVFYISLPSGHGTRNLAEEDFKQQLVEVYLKDYKKLCKVGWDEARFKLNFGFFSLKRYLEKLLNDRYVAGISPALSNLEELLVSRKSRLQKVQSELVEVEKQSIESQVSQIIGAYVTNVVRALSGTNQFDTLKNGFTLEEERTQSNVGDWPGFPPQLQEKLPIRNKNYKLYGGAQLERLLSEFEVVAHAQEFPQTTNDEVAVTIGVSPMHTSPDYIRGVTDLVQKKCRSAFKPLIETLLKRCHFVVKNLFRLVAKYMLNINSQTNKSKSFLEEVVKVSDDYLNNLITEVRSKTSDEFDTFIKVLDWDVIGGTSQDTSFEYDLLNPKEEDTITRVKKITDDTKDNIFTAFGSDKFKGRELTEEKCEAIKRISAQLFAGVRMMLVKYIKAKFNAFFLEPMFNSLDNFVRIHFLSLGPDKLKELFGVKIVQLKAAKENYQEQIKKLISHKELFTSLAEKFSANGTGNTTINNNASISDTMSNGSHSTNSTPRKKVVKKQSTTNGSTPQQPNSSSKQQQSTKKEK